MSLTRDLGRFVADVSFERLPERAVAVARIAPGALFDRLQRPEELSARQLTAID